MFSGRAACDGRSFWDLWSTGARFARGAANRDVRFVVETSRFVHRSARMLPTSNSSVTPAVPVVVVGGTTSQEQPQEQPNSTAPKQEGPKHQVPALERVEVWNLPFDRVTMDQAVDQVEHLIERGDPSYVITANLNYVMLHNRNAAMHPVSDDAALILADGHPIVARSRLGKQPLPQRVAGSEMIYHLAQRAVSRGWGIYFLGGEPGVAAKCAQALSREYPGLKIAGVESPPFRELSEQEKKEQADRIQQSGASLLLVAFGQPKGEQWIHEHYQDLGVPVSIQLGASFDFIAGTAKRAPKFWQRVGLEWLYRMFSNPRRLAPRYAANAWFLIGALVEDWKRQVTRWGMGQWVDEKR